MRFLSRALLVLLTLPGLSLNAEASRWNPYAGVFPQGYGPLPVAIDSNGNRLSQVETNAARTEETTYTYDAVNRLETVIYPDRTVEYDYDLAGNRIRELTTGVEGSDKTFHYDAINRLETITDNLDPAQNTVYAYDENGNTRSKTKAGVETRFLYDIRDQLGEVQQDASILGRYGYDYDGRRILKIGADGRRHYTYDQLSVITEADETNATVSKYEFGPDQLLSLNNRNEGRSFFHLDILGSTVNLTQPNGSARQSIFYDAWGIERERIGTSANNFTFTGHELDRENGLVYFGARFYDPEIGRFLTQDPVLGRIELTPSLHRYTYVGNRPTVKIDPLGLYEEDVHRGLTEFLAGAAGFDPVEVGKLSGWTQSIDEDPRTKPTEKGIELEVRKQAIYRSRLDESLGKVGIELDRPLGELEQVLTEW